LFIITYLKCHLRGEDQLVAFEKTTRSVLKHRIRYTIDQIGNTQIQSFARFSLGYGLLEHYTKSLKIKIYYKK